MSELYELPDGWEWIEFSKVFNTPTSKPYQIQKTEYLENGLLPIIDQGKEFIIGYTNSIEKKYSNESNCIIFGDHTRQIKYVDFDFVIGADGTKILKEKDKNKYDLKFLYFQFLSKKIESLGYSRHFKLVKQMFFAIPPHQEQQRIVSKLDLLFEKIDKSIALHQKNMDEANAFMGSVLNDIFGELEEKYEVVEVGKITNCIVPQRNKPKQFIGDIKWITTDDLILFNRISESSKGLGLRREEIKESQSKIIPKESVIMSCVGYLGMVSIADVEMVVNQQLHTFQCSELLNNKYLMYALYVKRDYMYSIANITTVAYMNKSKCNSIPLPLPPLKIQQKTVTYLDEISQKIEKIKQLQKEKMASLKALKASILDSAFRGEL